MQMVKKISIIIVAILLSIIIFSPKRELYYLLEDKLKENSIVLYEESIDNNLFTLTVKDAKVSVNGLKLGTIGELDITSFLFYSIVTIYDVSLSSTAQAVAPFKTLNIKISHNIFSPTTLNVTAKLGELLKEAKVKMIDNKIRVYIKDIDGMKYIAPFMRKDKQGWYYETNI